MRVAKGAGRLAGDGEEDRQHRLRATGDGDGAGLSLRQAQLRLHGDPPRLHGPYAYWTRKVDGKTVARILTEEQMADYGPLFDNEKRLKELLAELHEVSIGIVTDDERGQPRRKRPGDPERPQTPPARSGAVQQGSTHRPRGSAKCKSQLTGNIFHMISFHQC